MKNKVIIIALVIALGIILGFSGCAPAERIIQPEEYILEYETQYHLVIYPDTQIFLEKELSPQETTFKIYIGEVQSREGCGINFTWRLINGRTASESSGVFGPITKSINVTGYKKITLNFSSNMGSLVKEVYIRLSGTGWIVYQD